MRTALYLSACEFAGPWLGAAPPTGPVAITRDMPAGPNCAVYIVCDWGGRVLYVGSTTAGVAKRLRQHQLDVDRSFEWADVWIVPLRDDTPSSAVRRVEGLIGLALRPLQSRALPVVQ